MSIYFNFSLIICFRLTYYLHFTYTKNKISLEIQNVLNNIRTMKKFSILDIFSFWFYIENSLNVYLFLRGLFNCFKFIYQKGLYGVILYFFLQILLYLSICETKSFYMINCLHYTLHKTFLKN